MNLENINKFLENFTENNGAYSPFTTINVKAKNEDILIFSTYKSVNEQSSLKMNFVINDTTIERTVFVDNVQILKEYFPFSLGQLARLV